MYIYIYMYLHVYIIYIYIYIMYNVYISIYIYISKCAARRSATALSFNNGSYFKSPKVFGVQGLPGRPWGASGDLKQVQGVSGRFQGHLGDSQSSPFYICGLRCPRDPGACLGGSGDALEA